MKGLCLTLLRAAGWGVPVVSPGPKSVKALFLRPGSPEKLKKERLTKEQALECSLPQSG